MHFRICFAYLQAVKEIPITIRALLFSLFVTIFSLKGSFAVIHSAIWYSIEGSNYFCVLLLVVRMIELWVVEERGKVMLEVEQLDVSLSVAASVSTLLDECSAIIDYRTLRDSLPKRLAHLLKCRCVLLYQKVGETLQFASGTYDEQPGWSTALLSVVHINPVALSSDVAEAQVWRTQTAVAFPSLSPTRIAAPLVYRQRCVGVLVAIRSGGDIVTNESEKSCFTSEEVRSVTALAGVAALLLENTRLLERDRERVHTLSLLTTMSSQMTYALYETERLRALVIQRVREIARVDVCDLIDFSSSEEHPPWITSELRVALFSYFNEHSSSLPLVIERPGNVSYPQSVELLQLVPTTIKTFFAFPLLGSRPLARQARSTRKTTSGKRGVETSVLGVVIGGYQQAWKLRREDAMLLQVVVSQASAVLENMQLVAEVVEARNEARKLLRRVLEDQRLKALILESIPSGLITMNMQGHITTFNAAAQTILGYSAQEVMGKSLQALLHMHLSSSAHEGSHYFLNAASSPLRKDAFQHVLTTGEAQRGTLLSSDQRSQELILDMDIQPLCNNQGKQVGALITFVDVTSVHRLEEEKRRLDRLASLGEMAANVAHEVRNPLASIKTSVQMLLDDLSDEGEEATIEQSSRVGMAQESTTVMLKEVERLDTIVRDMLLFAKPRQLHRSTCNLIELSDHVLQLMRTQCADSNVQIQRKYEAIPALWVDIGQIEQVLFNLYTNALQAMSEGGVLTISCRVIVELPIELRQQHSSEPQQWLELVVADTGVGISSDGLKRIFQPFFTTKAHGIGLGLPITRRLIEDHGGTLHVESQPGKGTTMTVRLPVLTVSAEEEK